MTRWQNGHWKSENSSSLIGASGLPAADLLGISFFVLSLDVLANAKDIQALRPGDSSILLEYMLYRAPSVLVNYMGISMLLAMLLSLTELSYRNEMAAIWSVRRSDSAA